MSKFIGNVSAYAYAVEKGYTGTEEEFALLMASYATVGQTAVEAAQTATTKASEASQSATTAINKASEATTAAQTATTKASEVQTNAQTASTKASEATTAATAAQTAKAQTEAAASQALTDISTARSGAISAVQTEGQTQTANARAQARAAAQSATTASTKASEADASATTATTKATEAAASATSAAQSASDAQDVLDSIPADYSEMSADVEQLKADLADVTNHAVKSAEQLISGKRTTDKVPYKYRASQSGKSDRAYDMIVGGTVCFNQILQNGDFSNGTNGWRTKGTEYGTLSASDGICTYTIGSTQSNLTSIVRPANLISEHVYACIASINPSKQTSCRFLNSGVVNGSVSKVFTANTWGKLETIVKTKQALQYATIYVNTASDLQENDTVAFKHIMFMDLTAMFGIAIADYIYTLEQSQEGAGVSLFKQMFPNEYYPYNAGGLVNVEGLSAHVMCDEDDNIVGSYPLDSSLTLRGVPVLKDGKVEFDGDTYEADGTVTRRYGIVDLGALTWSRTTSYTNAVLYASVPSKKVGDTISAICAKYMMSGTYTSAQGFSVSDDKTFGLGRLNAQIFVRDDSFTDSTAFKSAMSGVYLVYELATPTTEEATPYASPQIVSPYGTEEYISESVCPVGHVTEYPDNLRAKIDGLPWDLSMIAPVEVAYTATRNYTTGQLLIVDNVLYKVTSNIANGGTITVGTNVAATTLSEVISALA